MARSADQRGEQWDEREGSAQSVLKSSCLLAPRYPKRSSLKDGAYLMVRARLSENRSTAPTFREGDLLVANLVPVTVAVHQVSFVVRADGRFESSERVTASRDRNSIYHKETGVIPSPEFGLIQSMVQAFATAAEPILRCVIEEGPDPFEAETADRRSLGYEFRTEHRTMSTWMLNYGESYDQRSECVALFNEIWQRLLGLLVMRYFTFDAEFAAPVQSLA